MARLHSWLLPTVLLFLCGSYAQGNLLHINGRQVPKPPSTNNAQAPSSNTQSYSTSPASAPSSLTITGSQDEITSSSSSPSRTHSQLQPPSSIRTSTLEPPVRRTSSVLTIRSTANQVSVAIVTTPTATPSVNNNTLAYMEPQIPIHPGITPGLSLAGIVFLVTGTLYTLVGIRNRWLYIVLGSAYLTGLAVTVLIVYVAVPPVSNAVQGAYFVAAFLTGVILGGLSLIFTEVTEYLGSIFGGFCVAMWLLCLKSGGLLTSTGSRVALIASFCVAFLAGSVSRHTKTYTTIGSSSFAGATVVLLGVDCFSRAGLKEFWLYIWGLNRNLFPIGTNTYPLVRGIQAELACIVVIFLFGLMSQMRLWKIVKQKRAERDAERLQGEQALHQLESNLGRRIETRTNRERARWEAIYSQQEAATKSASDYQSTTSASVRKMSTSFRDTDKSTHESVEMVDLDTVRTDSQAALIPNASGSTGKPSLIVRVADESSDCGYMNYRLNKSDDPQDGTSPMTSRQPSARSSWGRESLTQQPVSILKNRNTLPPSPAVVPLPFSVPMVEDEHDDAHSMATIAETDDSAYEDPHPRENMRLSNSGKRVSALSHTEVEEDFAIDIPHIEDDRASSLAATLDDLTDDEFCSLPNLSPRSSLAENSYADENYNSSPKLRECPSDLSIGEASKSLKHSNILDSLADPKETLSADVDTSVAGIKSLSDGPISSQLPKKSLEISNSKRKRISVGSNRRRSIQSAVPTELSEQGSNSEAVKRQLSGTVSKVAMSYRTNEWAKHLEAAEKPDIDDLSSPSVSMLPTDRGFVETPAPVQIEDLQQGANITENGYISRTLSLISKTNPFRGQAVERSISDPVLSAVQVPNPATFPRPPSTMSFYANTGLQRSDSQASMYRSPATALMRSASQATIATRGFRSGSIPILAQTLVESPIEEAAAENTRAPSRPYIGVIPSTSTPNINVMGPGDSMSIPNARFDDDNMSLSSRKRMIDFENQTLAKQREFLHQHFQQTQQQQLAETARQNIWSIQQNVIYDSHQPQRGSIRDDGKRQALLASWRESVRQELNPGQVEVPDEGRRMAMLNERRQVQLAQQQQAAAANYRHNMFDAMMRQGTILDLHQEAMRRMQAQAQAEANKTI